MNIATLLCGVVLAGSVQGQNRIPGTGLSGKPLEFFQSVIKRPTGNNGFEDYVEAAALVQHPEFADFIAFEVWAYQKSEVLGRDAAGNLIIRSHPGSEPSVLRVPPGLSAESSILELRQTWIRRFGGAIDLIRRGNLKPVYQPREQMGMDTLFPELAQFKQLCRLIRAKAQVEFAAGTSASATDALLEGLKFARNVGDGPMIQMLVSLGMDGMIFLGFEEGLGRLSVQDANRIVKTCNELLKRPALSTAAFAAEFAMAKEVAKSAVDNPENIFTSAGEDHEPVLEAIQKLGANQKAAVQARIVQYIGYKQRQLEARLSKPESEWHRYQDVPLAEPTDSRDPIEWLASRLVNQMSPVYSQALQAQARRRAQLRILRASARVIAYKWTHGKLPTKLTDAAPESEIEDPASGLSLRYEIPAPGMFRIQSEGFGEDGPFGLVYRRPPPKADRGPIVPEGGGPPPPG